ncbi:hypothetical protein BJ170DRAFT_729479 [Xylariales sp. AK1849]|nr:hypothetical protein BJ170DRAFT_729479 [Xylariales sp. AK1849]
MISLRADLLVGLLLLLLLPGVFADFGVMTADITFCGVDGCRTQMNYIFPALDAQINCGDVWLMNQWGDRSDVSGDKHGVRYTGSRPSDPDQIEFNNNLGHYTMYKNRDYHVAATDDKDSGQCRVVNDFKLDCARFGQRMGVRSIVRCTSSVIKA